MNRRNFLKFAGGCVVAAVMPACAVHRPDRVLECRHDIDLCLLDAAYCSPEDVRKVEDATMLEGMKEYAREEGFAMGRHEVFNLGIVELRESDGKTYKAERRVIRAVCRDLMTGGRR